MTPLCPERLALQRAVASLDDEHADGVLTADQARAKAVKCGRRVDICLKAGEYEEAGRQLDEAKRFSLLAIELERKVA